MAFPLFHLLLVVVSDGPIKPHLPKQPHHPTPWEQPCPPLPGGMGRSCSSPPLPSLDEVSPPFTGIWQGGEHPQSPASQPHAISHHTPQLISHEPHGPASLTLHFTGKRPISPCPSSHSQAVCPSDMLLFLSLAQKLPPKEAFSPHSGCHLAQLSLWHQGSE